MKGVKFGKGPGVIFIEQRDGVIIIICLEEFIYILFELVSYDINSTCVDVYKSFEMQLRKNKLQL